MANKVKYAYDEDGEPIFDADGERVVDSTVTSPSNGQEQQSSDKSIGQQIWSGLKQGYKNDRRIIGQPLAVSAAISSGIKSIFTGNNPVEAARNAYNREDSNAYEGNGITGTVADPLTIASMLVPGATAAKPAVAIAKNFAIQGLVGGGTEAAREAISGEEISGRKIALNTALGGLGGATLGMAGNKAKEWQSIMKNHDELVEAATKAKEAGDVESLTDLLKNSGDLEKLEKLQAGVKSKGTSAEGRKSVVEAYYKHNNTPVPKKITERDYIQAKQWTDSEIKRLRDLTIKNRAEDLAKLNAPANIPEAPRLAGNNMVERGMGIMIGHGVGGVPGAIIGGLAAPLVAPAADATAKYIARSPKMVKGLMALPRATNTAATTISDLIVDKRKSPK